MAIHEGMTEHDRSIGLYWACEHPESPHSQYTCYEEKCAGCVIAAEAALLTGNGDWFGWDRESDELIGLDKWLKKVKERG